jgi:hypothetical protein
MLKKRVFIFSLFCLLAVSSCLQPIANSERTPGPTIIDGTPYDNPMAMIEHFARQTAAAQTRVVESNQPSILGVPPLAPDYSSDRKLLHVVFPDGRKISYSTLELGALPQTAILVRNGEVFGVSLIALLQQAGWDAFDVSAVSLNGIGSLTLPRDQITQEYLLVFSGSSIKFISSSISESLWIDGVAVIEIY